MSKPDYYQTLEISKDASQADIKKAYHKLAMKYHPDRNPGNAEAAEKIKEINEAYDVLRDEKKKKVYDQFGHSAFNTGGGQQHSYGFGNASDVDINDIFQNFFGDVMGAKRQTKRSSIKINGSDLKYNLPSLTLEEVFTGVTKVIKFKTEIKCNSCSGTGSLDSKDVVSDCYSCRGSGVTRSKQGFFYFEQPCNTCHGSGYIIKNPCKKCAGEGRYHSEKTLEVKIPKGITEGNRIKLEGEGESGIRGGRTGDLYVFVTISTHKNFKVVGHDLHHRINIKFTTAALGGEVKIKDLMGNSIILKVPAGTQNAEKLKLSGKGMPIIGSSGYGDMIVHINIEIPKNLTDQQKELLKNLDQQLELHKSESCGFFNKVKNLWSGDIE